MIINFLIRLTQGTLSFSDFVIYLIFTCAAVVIALTVHESAHALVSTWLGDNTAKYQGRISLNPFRHVNWIGMVFLLVFGFGWANPVQVKASRFKKPRLGMALTAAAGPFSNFLIAFILTFFWVIADINIGTNIYLKYLLEFLSYCVVINLSFGIFNLIPLPPLDGSKILGECLPLKYRYKYYDIERYSMFIFMALILLVNRVNFIGIIQVNIFGFFRSVWVSIISIFMHL